MPTLTLKATTPTNCGCCSSCPGVLIGSPLPYDEEGDTSEADAVALMASNVADCLALAFPTTSSAVDSISASKGTNSFSVSLANHSTEEGVGAGQAWAASIKLKAGSTLTIAYTVSVDDDGPFIFATLFNCDGTETLFTGFGSGTSGTLTLGPLATDGEFLLEIDFGTFDEGGTAMSSVVDVSSDNTMTENKVEIHWDDHGISGKVTC